MFLLPCQCDLRKLLRDRTTERARDIFQTLINHNKFLKRCLNLGNLKAISRDNVVHLNFTMPLHHSAAAKRDAILK